MEQSKLSEKLARTSRYPTISLTGGLGDSHLTGGSNNFFSQMKTNFNANIGLGISIPILDNRKTKSAIEKAQVQTFTSSLDLIDKQKQLYSTIETYWLNAVNNREKYISAKANTASMEESYNLLQEQFTLGLKNLAELLTSRGNLLSAKQTMLQDKYTAVLNRTLLEFYSGEDIEI